MDCKKGFKEWNAVVEALGQGKQSILIRAYSTTNKEFLLYPTFSYANKDDYLTMFKANDQKFVEEHALPLKKDDQVEIKYFARIEEIIERSPTRIGSIDKMHIWSKDHVKNYLKNKKAFIWALRVYQLKEPFFAERNNGMLFANLKKGGSLEGMEPILNDKDFENILSII
jgi:restriction system protein